MLHPSKLKSILILLCTTGCMDYSVSRKPIYDSFVQPSRDNGVDILWVVDNSASMYEEQDQLAEHADGFTSFLSRAPVDFQLAVVTTDVDVEDPGRFVDDPLTPDTPNLADAFGEQIFMDEGSRDERGFTAALAALDASGPNGELLRQDADLEVVFFSDEDDQSDLGAMEFVEEVMDIRPGVVWAINAITGDPPEGCASIFGAADAGLKYMDATEESEGLRESICSLDYNTMLQRVAMKVLGLKDRIVLSSPPDLSTVEVRVDDAIIYRRTPHGWRYDAGENSIVFDGFAVPPPGSSVGVKYFNWMGPPESLEESLEE